MNNIVLIGRLTRDPELKYTQSGKAVCKFDVAVNGRKKDDVDYIPIIVWDKQGENCERYLKKGSQCAVNGRLSIRSYQDKEGKNRKASEVVANNVEFLSTKSEKPHRSPFVERVENNSCEDEIPF